MANEEYRRLDKAVKNKCRKNKGEWIEDKGKEAQEAAQRNDSRTLYRVVQKLTNAGSSSTVPIKSKNGQVLLTHQEPPQRWIEHNNEVLNQSTPNLFDFRQKADVAVR